MLALQGLSRLYGQTVALDGLSLEVPQGEVVGFVGPNGAGKTTAMRIALGVLEADAGEVFWRGEPATREVQRGFGYMPEVGHGLFGSTHHRVRGDSVRDGLDRLSGGDLANTASILGELSRFPTLADRLQQVMLNFLFELQPAAHPQHRLRPLRGPDVPGHPNELERPLLLSMVQMLWDRGEPNGYAQHMTDRPYPNTPAHTVLLHWPSAITRWPTWPPRLRRARSARASECRPWAPHRPRAPLRHRADSPRTLNGALIDVCGPSPCYAAGWTGP